MSSAAGIQVLVVEDDPDMAELIRQTLESDGMTVHQASDLAAARAELANRPPDVVVLDLQLADGSGLDLLRDPATLAEAPAVILSARHSEVDRIVGLEMGAEDYVPKPFFPRELAMRVRRAAGRRQPSPASRLDVGELSVDLRSRETAVRGAPVALTDREFELLAYLAASPGRVIGRDELLRAVWQSEPTWQSSKTINEHVRRLRTKIEDDPGVPRRIITVGRAGYRLDA